MICCRYTFSVNQSTEELYTEREEKVEGAECDVRPDADRGTFKMYNATDVPESISCWRAVKPKDLKKNKLWDHYE